MKIRTFIAAALGAILVAAGAFLLPAVASAGTATHTLSFLSVEKGSVALSKTMLAQQDTDTSKGKVIGYDELYLAITSNTTANGWVTLDVDGGFIYGTFSVNLKTGAITNGKVTGGARAFKGITGTFTAKDVSSTKTAIVLTYHS